MAPPKAASALPQLNLPKPQQKLRSFQWQKIPPRQLQQAKGNIWSEVAQKTIRQVSVDFSRMEELFSISQPKAAADSSRDPAAEKKKKENTEINLLDGKRSLNVNIFLKQFRMPHAEIVQLLRAGDSSKVGLEKLRGLQKILPQPDEMELITNFDGDKEKLGNAEKFFLCLQGLPNYKLRIEGMLTKEDFYANMEDIEPSIKAIVDTARDIKENQSLKELMAVVLMAGNFLNSGNPAGNAAAFKISSLLKLTDTRSNKPRMTLMHYVVMEAEEKNPKLLNFPNEMPSLEEAAKVSVEVLMADITSLTTKVRTLTQQIERTKDDFRNQMASFLMEANENVDQLEASVEQLEKYRAELCEYFCEDPKTFKLEECFKQLSTFCQRFNKAIKENLERRQKEALEEAKQKKKGKDSRRNSKDLREPGDQSMERGDSGDETNSIVDDLLKDVRTGNVDRNFSFGYTKVEKTKLAGGMLEGITTGKGEARAGGRDSPSTGSFVRGGSGRVSMRRRKLENGHDGVDGAIDPDSSSLEENGEGQQQRSGGRQRKSFATEDDAEFLANFLNVRSEDSAKKADIPDMRGSFRRRKLEKRPGIMDVFQSERERAPSPAILENGGSGGNSTPPLTNGSSGDSVKARPSSLELNQGVGSAELARPDSSTTPRSRERLRRSRSWVERPLNASSTVSEDEDDILVRLRRKYPKNRDSSSSSTPEAATTTTTTTTVGRRSQSASPVELTETPKSSEDSKAHDRWRQGIPGVESPRTLATISEKDSVDSGLPADLGSKPSKEAGTQEARTNGVASPGPRTSPTPGRLSDVSAQDRARLAALEKEEGPALISARDRLSLKFKSSIDRRSLDKALQSPEGKPARSLDDCDVGAPQIAVSTRKQMSQNYGKDIDQMLKNIEDNEKMREMAEDVAEANLKVKREKRKKRSQLSMDDVHAALRSNSPASSASPAASTASTSSSLTAPPRPAEPVSSQLAAASLAKTPPSPRRARADSDHSERSSPVGEKSVKKGKEDCSSKELSKAAKLAGKRKFRADRFGVGDSRASEEKEEQEAGSSSTRWRSNVEKNSVDQALMDFVSKGNMSRSKSYDESVAKHLANSGEFSLSKSGSSPGTSDEKRATLRNSTSKLFSDGRRNGLYIPSDEDEDGGEGGRGGEDRRPSSAKSDSSRSLPKSTNTSTETLRAEAHSDGDSSPHQERKQAEREEVEEVVKKPAPYFGTVNPKNHMREEDEDVINVPMVMSTSKTRRHQKQFGIQRQQQQQHYGSQQPSSAGDLHAEVGDLRNDVGSRSSYASCTSSCTNSSTDRDEGFESMSGISESPSTRTSYCSQLGTSDLPTVVASPPPNRPKSEQVLQEAVPKAAAAIMADSLTQMDQRERLESWTAYTVQQHTSAGTVSKSSVMEAGLNFSPSNASPEGNKENQWTEAAAAARAALREGVPSIEEQPPTPTSPTGPEDGLLTPTSTPKAAPKSAKTPAASKSVPSYMRGTATTATRRKGPAPATPDSSSLSRDPHSRLSMRAASNKTPTSSRLSAGTAATGKSKTGSSGSLVSDVSSTSTQASSTRRRLTTTSSGGMVSPSSPGAASSTSSSLSRTQSMRAPARRSEPFSRNDPTRASMRAPRTSRVSSANTDSAASSPATLKKASTLNKTPTLNKTTLNRSNLNKNKSGSNSSLTSDVSATSHEVRVTLAKGRQSTPSRRTTPSQASPASTSGTASPSPGSRGGFTRAQSMRVTGTSARSKAAAAAAAAASSSPSGSGKEGPETPKTPTSTTPTVGSRSTPARRSFMAPTASSKARLDVQSPTPLSPQNARVKSPTPSSARSTPTDLKRHSSLRLSSGKASEAVRKAAGGTGKDSPSLEGKHLAAVAESSIEAAEASKDKSLLKRIGLTKAKSPSSRAEGVEKKKKAVK